VILSVDTNVGQAATWLSQDGSVPKARVVKVANKPVGCGFSNYSDIFSGQIVAGELMVGYYDRTGIFKFSNHKMSIWPNNHNHGHRLGL